MNPISSLALAALLFIAPPAHAQSSGSSGGGHDGHFKNIRDEIKVWLFKNHEIGKIDEKLQLSLMTGADLKARYEQAVKDVGEKILFNHDEISFVDEVGNKNTRICKNESTTITCNITGWERIQDGRLKYLIVFHEYLGVARIETNQTILYSRYPISPKIMRFVHAIEAFELGMDETDSQVVSYRQKDFDLQTILGGDVQRTIRNLFQQNNGLHYGILTSPKAVESYPELGERMYTYQIFEREFNTPERMQSGGQGTLIYCKAVVTVKTWYPREAQMKKSEELQREFRQNSVNELKAIDEQLLKYPNHTPSLFRAKYLIETEARNTESLQFFQTIGFKSKTLQELFRIEEQNLEARQSAQQQQQQQQQTQQQQAMAPTPEVAVKFTSAMIKCGWRHLKGGLALEDNSEALQFAKDHRLWETPPEASR